MCISQGYFYVLNQFDTRLTHGTLFFPHNSEDDLKQVRKEEGIPDLEEDDHGEEKREMQVQEWTVEAMTSTEDLANDHEWSDTACVGSRDGDGDEANVEERFLFIGAKKSIEVTCEKKRGNQCFKL